jgi:hypothetical protein
MMNNDDPKSRDYKALGPSYDATASPAGVFIKALLTLNGGAALVLMSFVGSVVSKPGKTDLAVLLAGAILKSGAGAGIAVVGAGLGYVSQALYLDNTYYRIEKKDAEGPEHLRVFGDVTRILAVTAGVVSLCCYFWALLDVFHALRNAAG